MDEAQANDVRNDTAPPVEAAPGGWRERVTAGRFDGRTVIVTGAAGSIVNVASEAALRGSTAGIAYTASKHAVAPGGVATGIARIGTPSEFGRRRIREFLQLIPPVAQAEQLAASITFLLSDDGVNVNGAVLPSDGGWVAQ
ncbi:SDR family NAD(P)-dependent oxidoreductase [Amycolatopsis sp. NBC_00345]|uniref:SDR family NAD(P)-dependent oxidoreductase n=1 Tax=Amycolatopsis sp. NBC_00345 TaxID=2975955 RepID=UPI002E255D49